MVPHHWCKIGVTLVFGVNYKREGKVSRKPVVPVTKQPITDRKLRVIHVVMGGGRGLYPPVQCGSDGKGNVHFQGRPLNDYTKEEFEEIMKPFEERLKADEGL